MLNELKEYEEYTCQISGKFPHRMHKSNVAKCNKTKIKGKTEQVGVYAGVPRALKIIARYMYYHKGVKDVEKVKDVLKLWCGFEEDGKESIGGIESFKELKGWLPRYLHFILLKNDDEEKYKSLYLDLTERRKELWCRGAFQQSGRVNDENSIYFESIIAEAIDQGELKEYYLVFDKDPMEGFAGNTKFLYDRGLKLVAAWLLNRIPDSDFAGVDFAAYSNWVNSGCTDGGKVTTRVIPNFTYSYGSKTKTPIFSCEYIDRLNKHNPMLCLDKYWKDNYKPRLIRDLKEAGESAFVFRDDGCGSPLNCIKKPNY